MKEKEVYENFITIMVMAILVISAVAITYQPSMTKCESISDVELSYLDLVNNGTDIYFFDACKYDVVYIGQERGYHTFTLWQGNNMISMLKIIGIQDEYVQQKNNIFDFKIVASDEAFTIFVKDLWWK